ncbi:alkaline phosphatase [uncultured Acetobacteroides sp.]|uniref:alkaline phosphatase n=1 Tax=uncultured Acetobacteroides sp. TaxID=1760811 RepID=UPI0029F4898F|nr:alkaline phosphatase [uncultured Acetobacteroides sp.]
MKRILIAALMLASSLAYAQKAPKNIILMIGDGMGYNSVALRMLEAKGTSNFERFNSIGSVKTYSAGGRITDSGAGGTAYAIGEKTYNGAIGVDTNKQSKPNLMEIAQKNKLATGIVVTCALTHATPASFSAHQVKRDMYEAIAGDIINSNVDLLVGGGMKYFAKRKDGRNLIDEAKTKGYSIYTDTTSYFSSDAKKAMVVVADDHLKPANKERGNYLAPATLKTVELLKKENKNGFVMMVEGSQIDWAEHNNDAEYLKTELADFDKTIGAVLDFAQKDGNTLVIVLADHDTGGVTLPPAEVNSLSEEYGNYAIKFSTGAHCGTLIPVFAYGPGAEKFQGIYQNSDVFHKIMQLKKWGK